MNDGIKFRGKIEYILRDQYGYVKDSGVIHNQVQDLLLTSVIDAIDTATFPTSAPIEMAIGSGTGQDTTQAGLASIASYEVLTTSDQPTTTSFRAIATFTAVAATITEAGLCNVSGCATGMLLYNDALNVVMTAPDSLQITWTLSVTST